MNRNINPLVMTVFMGMLLVFSCEKDNLGDNTCDVKNPVKDIGWIKNDINYINSLTPDESQYIAIMMAKYNGVTVFYSVFCDPEIDTAYPIRNCSGETIGYYGEILSADLKEQLVIWKSWNCICVF